VFALEAHAGFTRAPLHVFQQIALISRRVKKLIQQTLLDYLHYWCAIN
jgi:hypothetical protein